MAGFFGGLIGKAEKAIKGRKNRIDMIVDAGNKQAKKTKKKKNG